MSFQWGCLTCTADIMRECPIHGRQPIIIPRTIPGPDVNLQEMIAMDAPISGEKKDEGKPRMDLLSPIALECLAEVLTFGCKKYSANNWRLGLSWGRTIAAVLRHIFAWMRGQTYDPETGLSHLGHAMCGIMFLLEYAETHKELDDRYVVINVPSEPR